MPGNMRKPQAPKPRAVKPPKGANVPQAKNLTPPNAPGVKKTKTRGRNAGGPKNPNDTRMGIGTGKNGIYW